MSAPRAPTVYKFGGTSIGDAERIRHVARLVAEAPRPLVVVLSAMAGVTTALQAILGERSVAGEEPTGARPADASTLVRTLGSRHHGSLEALAPGDEGALRAHALLDARLARLERDLTDDAPPGRMRRDAVLSAGEDLAQVVVLEGLSKQGVTAEALDARTLLVTDARFGRAAPDRERTRTACEERLTPYLRNDSVVVVQGFVGGTPGGETTTLGRGGSDFSAAVLGGALCAASVHVWTDVSGIMSGDPATVERPHLLEEIGFEELVELAWAGAKVIHPVAAKWAVAEGVPLRIRDTFHPDRPGTRVRHDVRGAARIAAITTKPAVALIRVRSHPAALPYGFLARVFGVLGRHRLEVDLVATSHSSTAFTIEQDAPLDEVAAELGTFADVEVTSGLVTVTVVGRGLLAKPGIGGAVFSVVGSTPVHLVSQASDVSLSLVVDEDDARGLARRLHAALLERRDGPERRTA